MKLLKAALVVVVVVVAYTEGVPWVVEQLDLSGVPDDGSETSLCVRTAKSAYDAFRDQVDPFTVLPIDMKAWDPVRLDLASRIDDGRLACGCEHPACREGADAVRRMLALLEQVDGDLRRGGQPYNPGRDFGEIRTVLREARQLARAD